MARNGLDGSTKFFTLLTIAFLIFGYVFLVMPNVENGLLSIMILATLSMTASVIGKA